MKALRRLLPLAALAMLAACQQAVRPNLGAAAQTPTHPMQTPAQAASPASPGLAEQPAARAAQPLSAASETSAPLQASAPPASVPLTSHGEVVFNRINKGLSPQACSAGSNSTRWRHRYVDNPAAFARHLEQILPLLDFVSTEVERAHLPAEFVFIPLVESWYRPEAMGLLGPAGMWQMIPSTARNHGIHIQAGYDGRLSPVESTRAALSYLKTLQGMFGGWEAIVMAYNSGEGRMLNAFRRAQNRHVSAADRKPHGLSNTTYDYVAKLQALSCLVASPQREGLQLPLTAKFVPLAPVLMDARVETLEQFAASQGQDAELLRRLNPGYKGGKVVAGVPRLVLTPIGALPAPVSVADDSAARWPKLVR